MSAELLGRLVAAGTPLDLVGEVALAIANAAAAARLEAEQPSKGALRMRRYRERHAASPSVTCDANDVTVTENVTADPAPNKSPPDPQKLTPTPCVGEAPAHVREAAIPARFLPLTAALAIAAYLAEVERAAAGAAAKRWRGMPPPAGVPDASWRGFLDNRRSQRKTLTPHAYTLLVHKLTKLTEDGWPPGQLIDTATERGWLTVFPPRESNHHDGHRNHHHRTAVEPADPLVAACAARVAGGDRAG
ncbi:MAG: hypothetical protein PGN09_07585 [Sphingomonas fennica]